MKRKYEKVIERCQQCPYYGMSIKESATVYSCKKRKKYFTSPHNEISKFPNWFDTCDLPEVIGEEEIRG